MKVYKFPHSKYVFTVDDEKHEFKVLRYGTEDITDSVMNNPLLDLLLAYDNLSERYESLENSIKAATNESILKSMTYVELDTKYTKEDIMNLLHTLREDTNNEST